jgi:primase-polymerase (primpol)-like protein
MTHLYDNVPEVLKQRPNWVAWGIPGAPPKSPFNPSSLLLGRVAAAKAGVKETWDTYESAVVRNAWPCARYRLRV